MTYPFLGGMTSHKMPLAFDPHPFQDPMNLVLTMISLTNSFPPTWRISLPFHQDLEIPKLQLVSREDGLTLEDWEEPGICPKNEWLASHLTRGCRCDSFGGGI